MPRAKRDILGNQLRETLPQHRVVLSAHRRLYESIDVGMNAGRRNAKTRAEHGVVRCGLQAFVVARKLFEQLFARP